MSTNNTTTNNEDLISSLYPPPPPYYKFFTKDNLQKLSTWQENNQTTTVSSEVKLEEENTDPDSNNLEENSIPPGELRFLIPPKQPEGPQYRGYGNIWLFEDKLPNLKDSQWEQLYNTSTSTFTSTSTSTANTNIITNTDTDINGNQEVDAGDSTGDENLTSETKIKELHKLMDSLLLNFLELIGILSIDPIKYDKKIHDINLILININHLLNTYRPHQSRESLIMLLKNQIDYKFLEIDQINKKCLDIKSKIKNLINERITVVSDDTTTNTTTTKTTGLGDGDSIDEKEQLKQDIINRLLLSI